MAKLRFEIWEHDSQLECAAVSKDADRLRQGGAVLVESFDASTHDEAMARRNHLMGWGPYSGEAGLTDQPFTDRQAAEQAVYLAVRGAVGRKPNYLLRWFVAMVAIIGGLALLVWLAVIGPLFVACQFFDSCV